MIICVLQGLGIVAACMGIFMAVIVGIIWLVDKIALRSSKFMDWAGKVVMGIFVLFWFFIVGMVAYAIGLSICDAGGFRAWIGQ
jgi:hypothetical protein